MSSIPSSPKKFRTILAVYVQALSWTKRKVSPIASAYGLTIGSRISPHISRTSDYLLEWHKGMCICQWIFLPTHSWSIVISVIWNNFTFRIPLLGDATTSHACHRAKHGSGSRLWRAQTASGAVAKWRVTGKTLSELSGELRSELVLWQVLWHPNHLHENNFGQFKRTHEPMYLAWSQY
jgi:hypothetical protein